MPMQGVLPEYFSPPERAAFACFGQEAGSVGKQENEFEHRKCDTSVFFRFGLEPANPDRSTRRKTLNPSAMPT
jgi:hypothetical protein